MLIKVNFSPARLMPAESQHLLGPSLQDYLIMKSNKFNYKSVPQTPSKLTNRLEILWLENILGTYYHIWISQVYVKKCNLGEPSISFPKSTCQFFFIDIQIFFNRQIFLHNSTHIPILLPRHTPIKYYEILSIKFYSNLNILFCILFTL